MTAQRAIPIARPLAVPALSIANQPQPRHSLAASRFAAPKDRQKVRLV
jgi:hypothetical protein